MDPQPEPPQVRLITIEVPVPGVLLGRIPLPEPADPIIGLTTDEDGGW